MKDELLIPSGEIIRDGRTVVILNDRRRNRVFCDVQPGFDELDKRTSAEECVSIAVIMEQALMVYNETKLSPRQMVERIEELEHQLAMADKAYNEACQHIRENTYPK